MKIFIGAALLFWSLQGMTQEGKFYYKLPKRSKHMTDRQHALVVVADLPEVKEWFITAKKSQPALLLQQVPDAQHNYYWISAGISNLDRFRTAYHFYVYPDRGYEVKYNDFNDAGMQTISLKQWRYWSLKPGWRKPHAFKNGKLVVTR